MVKDAFTSGVIPSFHRGRLAFHATSSPRSFSYISQSYPTNSIHSIQAITAIQVITAIQAINAIQAITAIQVNQSRLFIPGYSFQPFESSMPAGGDFAHASPAGITMIIIRLIRQAKMLAVTLNAFVIHL
jgi:hypothetical protein